MLNIIFFIIENTEQIYRTVKHWGKPIVAEGIIYYNLWIK
jgi:hypothetical protein